MAGARGEMVSNEIHWLRFELHLSILSVRTGSTWNERSQGMARTEGNQWLTSKYEKFRPLCIALPITTVSIYLFSPRVWWAHLAPRDHLGR